MHKRAPVSPWPTRRALFCIKFLGEIQLLSLSLGSGKGMCSERKIMKWIEESL